jgi:hypothetical protein
MMPISASCGTRSLRVRVIEKISAPTAVNASEYSVTGSGSASWS